MKSKSIYWLVVLVLICACGVVWYLRSAGSAGRYPAMSARDVDQWHTFGGQWSLTNGIYTDRMDGRGDRAVVGPLDAGDYTVSSDLRFDTPSGDNEFGDAGLVLRVTNSGIGVDAFRGYYAGLRLDDHALLIGAMTFDFRELANTGFPHQLRTGHWYHLDFTARGCTFLLKATDPETNDTAEVSYVEPSCTQTRGQVGVRSYYAKTSWRDFQVHLLPK